MFNDLALWDRKPPACAIALRALTAPKLPYHPLSLLVLRLSLSGVLITMLKTLIIKVFNNREKVTNFVP